MEGKVFHQPVMLDEVIKGLIIHPGGIYVDATYGGGGHSASILDLLGNGRLIAFDRDDSAFASPPADQRITVVNQNFRYLGRFLKLHGIEKIDGLVADLGVSSHQIDTPERGFSTRFESALDMRMDRRQELTAARILKSYPEERLHRLFEIYGELTNARTLARIIAEFRKCCPIDNTANLKTVLRTAVKGNPNRYLAQVFQALRIEVNDEMGALKDLLMQSVKTLKPGGRLAILTFQSLEDRMVKQFIRTGRIESVEEGPFERPTSESLLRPVNKKPLMAGEAELKRNPRARSAKLRVAERIADQPES